MRVRRHAHYHPRHFGAVLGVARGSRHAHRRRQVFRIAVCVRVGHHRVARATANAVRAAAGGGAVIIWVSLAFRVGVGIIIVVAVLGGPATIV